MICVQSLFHFIKIQKISFYYSFVSKVILIVNSSYITYLPLFIFKEGVWEICLEKGIECNFETLRGSYRKRGIFLFLFLFFFYFLDDRGTSLRYFLKQKSFKFKLNFSQKLLLTLYIVIYTIFHQNQ